MEWSGVEWIELEWTGQSSGYVRYDDDTSGIAEIVGSSFGG